MAHKNPAGNVWPDGKRSRKKIDGMSAAGQRHSGRDLTSTRTSSLYEKRGILWLWEGWQGPRLTQTTLIGIDELSATKDR